MYVYVVHLPSTDKTSGIRLCANRGRSIAWVAVCPNDNTSNRYCSVAVIYMWDSIVVMTIAEHNVPAVPNHNAERCVIDYHTPG